MKIKNILIIISFILLLSLLIGFYFYQRNNFTGSIISAHFEIYPEGTEMGSNMVGIVTNSFGLDNLVGISGESNVSKEVELTYKIFDSDGNKLESEWHGGKIKVNSGTFGFCCLNVPQTSGEYTIELFLNNKESFTLPFYVIG